MKGILPILLTCMIAFSGCIGQQVKTDYNNGLIINYFSADPAEGEDIDDFSLIMDIENVGGITASNVLVNFYGADEWTGTRAFGPYIMYPPDPLTNTPGDIQTIMSTLIPPDLPQGVDLAFPVTAKVIFDYRTTGTISIPAYSRTMYKIKEAKGEVESSVIADSTAAPVKVVFSGGASPVVVDDRISGSDDEIFLLEFINVGSGWPISPGTGGRIGALRGSISVSGIGVSIKDCLGGSGGTTVTINESNLDLTTMRSDGSIPISCAITIDRAEWGTTASGNIMFNIDMQYQYYVDSKFNLVVHGTEYSRSGGSIVSTTILPTTTSVSTTSTSVMTTSTTPTTSPTTSTIITTTPTTTTTICATEGQSCISMSCCGTMVCHGISSTCVPCVTQGNDCEYAQCCSGLFCDLFSYSTCQPPPLRICTSSRTCNEECAAVSLICNGAFGYETVELCYSDLDRNEGFVLLYDPCNSVSYASRLCICMP